jgi:cytosine/adenosine deaminase-related metal-dependent hydrolase
VYVEDGKIVNVEDGQSLHPSFAECVKVGDAGQATKTPGDVVF